MTVRSRLLYSTLSVLLIDSAISDSQSIAAEQLFDVTYCLRPSGGSDMLTANDRAGFVTTFDVEGLAWANDPAKKALDGFTLRCIGVQHTANPGAVDVTGFCTWTSPDKGDFFMGKFSQSPKEAEGKWEVLSGTGRFSQVAEPESASPYTPLLVSALGNTDEGNQNWSWCNKAAGKINVQ